MKKEFKVGIDLLRETPDTLSGVLKGLDVIMEAPKFEGFQYEIDTIENTNMSRLTFEKDNVFFCSGYMDTMELCYCLLWLFQTIQNDKTNLLEFVKKDPEYIKYPAKMLVRAVDRIYEYITNSKEEEK